MYLYLCVFCICISGIFIAGLLWRVGRAQAGGSSPLIRRESWARLKACLPTQRPTRACTKLVPPTPTGVHPKICPLRGPLGHAPTPVATQKICPLGGLKICQHLCGMCMSIVHPKICPHHNQGQRTSSGYDCPVYFWGPHESACQPQHSTSCMSTPVQ